MKKASERKRNTYHVGNLRVLLLSAAREMLEEVGPTKLSVRAVSDKVGVSCTAAYHHFANRTELVGCLAAKGFDELATVLAEQDRGTPKEEKIRTASLAYFSFARKNPALYQLMFGPEFSDSEMISELQSSRREAFGELKRIVAEYLDKDAQTAEVRGAALAGWSHTHGLASLVIHNVVRPPAEITDERFVDMSLEGFRSIFAG
ncbi:Nucleoid occlusion factor SlmA [Thalassocella blandensis]|nr:Nucleoid occlusion factor SlmA [Thalassocella blandensis]